MGLKVCHIAAELSIDYENERIVRLKLTALRNLIQYKRSNGAMMICNCCGADQWGDMGQRKGVRCLKCSSLERTRVLKLFLDHYKVPRPGMRVLHFAPDQSLYRSMVLDGQTQYDPVDFVPENFKFCTVRKFDLCLDAERLESNHYDVIIHSHVAEHIPCNITAVLFHVHRSLKPEGIHFMCVPFMGTHYEEDMRPLAAEEAVRRFGQDDHVRKFGKDDVHRNLGMLFKLPERYSLNDYFSKDLLDIHNIPPADREGFTSSTVFALKKEDLKLSLN